MNKFWVAFCLFIATLASSPASAAQKELYSQHGRWAVYKYPERCTAFAETRDPEGRIETLFLRLQYSNSGRAFLEFAWLSPNDISNGTVRDEKVSILLKVYLTDSVGYTGEAVHSEEGIHTSDGDGYVTLMPMRLGAEKLLDHIARGEGATIKFNISPAPPKEHPLAVIPLYGSSDAITSLRRCAKSVN